MHVTLRSLKIMKSLSEETTCFTATLVIDGKARGVVSNRGMGGCHEYSDRMVVAEMTAYAATLPNAPTFEAADALVDDAIEQLEFAKSLTKRVLMLNEQGQVVETKALKAAELPKHVAHFVGKGRVVLNAMPLDAAYATYRIAMGA